MDKETIGALAVMFNSFPQSQNTDADVLMMACKIALEGLRGDAIIEACSRFMKGQVPSHDPRYSPSVAQLALEAQDRQRIIELKEHAAKAPKIQHKPAPVGNLVSRQKMQAFADHLAGKITADELEQIAKAGA